MDLYIKNFEDLLHLTNKKDNLIRFLKKNYKENKHYIIVKKDDTLKNKSQRGGHNKITYMLTEQAFNLMKNTYNLRIKYLTDESELIKSINICMCIENQTIGFIENSYNTIINMKRQYSIGKYRIDLYFIDHKIAIECDENNHGDRDPIYEKKREDYIKSLGNTIIRFNPNEKNFDLSNVLREINIILFNNFATVATVAKKEVGKVII